MFPELDLDDSQRKLQQTQKHHWQQQPQQQQQFVWARHELNSQRDDDGSQVRSSKLVPALGADKGWSSAELETRLKQLALWVYVVVVAVVIVVWFQVNKLWNIFYCLLPAYFWVFVSNSGRRLSGMRNTKRRGSSWRIQKWGKRVNYAFCVVSIDDDDNKDHHHHYRHLVFSFLAAHLCKAMVTCDFSRQVPQRWPR